MTADTPLDPPESASSPAPPGAAPAYGASRRRAANFGRRRQLLNRLLRGALLLLLIAGVGGLTAVFLQGREERMAAANAAAPEEIVATPQRGEAVVETARLRAEQFESTIERDGTETFRIRGAQTSSDDEGNVSLNQVEVDYPQGEDRYSLSANAADYNEETQATRLEGDVSLEGTNGLAVHADWMDLTRGGGLLTAADDSRFSFEGVTARGDGLRMNFREEIARMGGGVELSGAEAPDGGGGEEAADSSQAFSLAAETLEYRWGAGIVRALGGAELQLGDFSLAARSLTMNQDGTGALASLEARGQVELRAPLGDNEDSEAGSAAVTAPEAVLVLRGEALSVQFDDARFPGRVTLSGPNWGGPAVLRLDYADGAQRRIRGNLIEFSFVDGTLAEFAARVRVDLQEFVPGRQRPLREASSVVAGGRFDARGALVELTLGGKVELTDRGGDAAVLARADGATIDPSTQRIDFRGRPARLTHSRGELEGATIVHDRASGCSEASGAVRVALTAGGESGSGALPLGPGGAEAGPSVVTAGDALLCESGESRFRDGVEVRRGADLLAASQVRIAADRRRLVADGGVRTVWHTEPPAGSGGAGETGTETAPAPWTIAAARLNYDEDAGELRYSGGAAAVLGEQKLDCDELTVEGGAGDSAAEEFRTENLICLGNVRLGGIGPGRSTEANRAIYAVDERKIRLVGDVVMREGTNELRGAGLVYWIDRGRYRMGLAGSAAAAADDS